MQINIFISTANTEMGGTSANRGPGPRQDQTDLMFIRKIWAGAGSQGPGAKEGVTNCPAKYEIWGYNNNWEQ